MTTIASSFAMPRTCRFCTPQPVVVMMEDRVFKNGGIVITRQQHHRYPGGGDDLGGAVE